MFERIAVVYHDRETPVNLATIEKVKNLLNENKKKFVFMKADEISNSSFADADLIITIGGDGTFTRAANFLKNELILGINSEPEKSEGALTSLMNTELACLNEILEGKFKTIQRQRVQTRLNGKILPKIALNEVYIGTSMQFHASRYIIEFKGKKEEHRSSGVIISTGSGSKAWYRSAGGVPFNHAEEKLKFLIREPYKGERLYIPTILNGEIIKGEKIIFKSTRDYGGIIALDNEIYDFNRGACAEIELAEYPLNVIII